MMHKTNYILLLSFILFFKTSYSYASDKFFLEPYKPNYILPISYKSGEAYNSYSLSDNYGNFESEFQISLKYNFLYNLFDLHETYFISYSQRAWWQIYSVSSPFREINYNPELFVSIPMNLSYKDIRLNYLNISFVHNSNGKGNIENSNPDLVSDDLLFSNNSRSLNYLELTSFISYKNLNTKLSFILPFLGDMDLSDNPDIYDYYGYFCFETLISLDDYYMSIGGRFNPKTNNGNIELNTYYTLNKKENLYIYFKYFYGYGESLIDYNNNVSKVSLGVAFNLPNLF